MMEGAGSVVQIPQTQKPVAQTQWHEAQLYEGSTVRRSMNLYIYAKICFVCEPVPKT